MSNQKYKTSALLFSAASLAFFILIVLYIFVYKPPSGTWDQKILYMENHWGLISIIWSFEFIAAVIIAFVSLNLSTINKSWNLIAVGHLLMLVEYMLMIGGYPKVSSEESFHLINNMALWIFSASNLIWLLGMTGVYFAETGWIKYLGVILSLIGVIIFLTMFFGLTTMKDIIIFIPVINLLYLLNTYYGFKILKNNKV